MDIWKSPRTCASVECAPHPHPAAAHDRTARESAARRARRDKFDESEAYARHPDKSREIEHGPDHEDVHGLEGVVAEKAGGETVSGKSGQGGTQSERKVLHRQSDGEDHPSEEQQSRKAYESADGAYSQRHEFRHHSQTCRPLTAPIFYHACAKTVKQIALLAAPAAYRANTVFICIFLLINICFMSIRF